MKHNVKVPSAGESVTEAYIGKWHKADGEFVKKGDVLVELESQKATFEIESEFTGQLHIVHGETGETVGIVIHVKECTKIGIVPQNIKVSRL